MSNCCSLGDGRSAVYGTVAADGVFDGVIEMPGDEFSVERADRYVRHANFPSVMYRHSDIATASLVNFTVCLSDLLHTAHDASPLRHQPHQLLQSFSVLQEQVLSLIHI